MNPNCFGHDLKVAALTLRSAGQKNDLGTQNVRYTRGQDHSIFRMFVADPIEDEHGENWSTMDYTIT